MNFGGHHDEVLVAAHVNSSGCINQFLVANQMNFGGYPDEF